VFMACASPDCEREEGEAEDAVFVAQNLRSKRGFTTQDDENRAREAPYYQRAPDKEGEIRPLQASPTFIRSLVRTIDQECQI